MKEGTAVAMKGVTAAAVKGETAAARLLAAPWGAPRRGCRPWWLGPVRENVGMNGGGSVLTVVVRGYTEAVLPVAV